MYELSKLPNIGKTLETQLVQVGIETTQQLKQIGSKQAWLSIKAIDPSACYNRLCALEGAIQGVRWYYLSDDTKKELKEFYNNLK
ncbi:TfoX/Sxy family protein [Sedimentibacter sp. zth1]|uniref:TfoX/Sxy family protein n=1 Tax=Sedimentibacter sp. zth1 TaxID=2816908 RepID=UPI001A9374C9|nr:TfoX/Sxy family protein [Sedimentibacter sp. zth1]QSX05721.1 TfoX/Sxy family protein [Sedimentibacter sp. zth1]